ncbi:hypothetical protein DQM68_19660 (plasmid) [Leptospira mayottensis]|uniref:hypothetical protein n=1 Tax=Leptospira mayottensis TaxID=1137606 RepID=UPI0002D5700C|nr:hypothetical protein [Leptospira mayottensis]AXR62871.1 hypothetical protein DQM68_19660 [Leptospira mayottensis]TGN00365.1 hypothetical protein EHR03_13140 [Leptospira mayottensis]
MGNGNKNESELSNKFDTSTESKLKVTVLRNLTGAVVEIEYSNGLLFYLSPGDNEIPEILLDVTTIKAGIESGNFVALRK